MHRAQAPNTMSTDTAPKPSNDKESSAFSFRLNLKKILTEQEAQSFAAQAEKEGRTIREHFLAITLGTSNTNAA